jgi:monofunctional biosynthetic peptidoglycan transglycosylase
MFRSVVAAEDANFCLHWGFDMAAIRLAVDQGATRGASTLSQQVVKNVFLWHGRNWARKAMEAAITPVMELVWTKRRILVVYLNVAEFGEGIFGVEAAAQHYFGVSAAELTAVQAARLAAVLPDPKRRNAGDPSRFVRNRARAIISGAETVAVDGRASCFERAPAE